jgi:hypothetical protein
MEKVAAAGTAGTGREVPLGRCTAVLLVAVVCPALWAQDGLRLPADLRADARTERAMRVEVNTSSLPRIEAQDGGFQAPRVDVSLLPANTTGLGPVLGMSTPRQVAPAFGTNATRGSVDLGLRYSHRLQSQQQIDVTAWRRMNSEEDAATLAQMRQPLYGARVEMNLTTKRSGFAAERGFIGLQLESGAKISFKRKDGRPMVYYRTSF